MPSHPVVSQDEWLAARRAFLVKEKEFTRKRDAFNAERRALPWVRVEKDYVFETEDGPRSLGELFDGRSQLVVYHFMLGPDEEEGCPSCSFWADNFEGIDVHLAHRDITLTAISRAPLATIAAYKQRMGWTFPWASAFESDFNVDFDVSFPPKAKPAAGWSYNFRPAEGASGEAPGVSVFYRDEDGAIYRTYSCYSRGLDELNGAYHYIDLAPKGRDEEGLPWMQAWVRRHDQYED